MALPFVYREEAPARQAIAQLQLEAAAAENASRERIAKEQTQQQRYATQSQISEREKDRAVSREDIASRERSRTGAGTDAASRERGHIQYQTILGEINEADPMTKRELEARIAASPQISEDLANNLRSARDAAYKNAKANYEMGEKLAKSYRSELLGKKPTDPALTDIHKRLTSDKNVIFDRATGNVESVFRTPREDGPVPGSGVLRLPGGAAVPSAAAPPTLGAVPTIGEMRARITGAPVDTSGLGNAVPIPATPPVTASDLAPPSMFSLIGPAAPREPMPGPMQRFRMPGGFGTPPRVSDLAPPTVAVPAPAFARPAPTFDLPQFASPAGDIDALIGIANDPRFPTLPQEHQEWILNEIGNASQRMPRVSDLQRLRPEYVPME